MGDMMEIKANEKTKEKVQETTSMETISSNKNDDNVKVLDTESEEEKERLKKEEIFLIQQSLDAVVSEYQDKLKSMKNEYLDPDQSIILHRQMSVNMNMHPSNSSSFSFVRDSYDDCLEKLKVKHVE